VQASQIFTKRNIARKEHVTGYLVKLACKFPGMEIYHVIAPLELVKLFQHHDGYYHIVFLKVVDACEVMQQNVRVKNKNLLLLFLFRHNRFGLKGSISGADITTVTKIAVPYVGEKRFL